jgi:hypothetical protein
MTLRRQLGSGVLALLVSAALASPGSAQKPDRPPQATRPPISQRPAYRPPTQSQTRSQPQSRRDDSNRPPATRSNPNRPPSSNRQTSDPNRPPIGQSSRGADNNTLHGSQRLTPEERQRVLLQNQQRFRQLSPQQQQEMRDRNRVWQQMTPTQREHITRDVLPTWRNLPPNRRKAIEQRLGVLQNMPEYARNQHLADPNFTRGMSDEDRATLRDLSHLHVGGAPDPPR